MHNCLKGLRMFKGSLSEKNIPRLMIIFPVLSVVVLTVLISYFYVSYRHQHFKVESERLKQNYITGEKKDLQHRLTSMKLLLEKRYENMEEPMSKELISRINVAYDTAEHLRKVYSKGYNEKAVKTLILGALSRMEWNHNKNFIWVTDKKGNNLLAKQKEMLRNILNYKDADGRFIIKEEIDAVNKYKQTFLKTRFTPGDPRVQLMFLKDFGHYDWFFGTGMHYIDEYNHIKKNIITLLSAVQTDPDEYFYITTSKGKVIYHPDMEMGKDILEMKDKDGFAFIKEQVRTAQENKEEYVNYISKSRRYDTFSNKTSYSLYFEPFDWVITTGFYALNIQQAIDSQQESLKKEIENEIKTILLVSFIIAVLVILLTLGLSRSISEIFLNYKERVQAKEDALHELNDSLKARVMKEVEAQREKEKMLIQQSKMAAMGDMISMIAHQWRQPLNQMSYVMMNIDGAYDERTLSREYLDGKLKEGENLLEYMSHTIDDFRNFFKPDKQKQEVQLCALVDSAIGLIQKSLEKHHIELETDYHCDKELLLFKNEMIQVLLNLLKNAQEAVEGKENPVIKINIYENDTQAIITVSDNGGGIKEENLEKVFEPYFSTKEKQGTGLGLYMSQMIVMEHMSGTLEAKNSENGAEFIISLPL